MKKTAGLLTGEVVDLTAAIEVISPTDTPLTTIIRGMGNVVPAEAVNVTWREEALDTNTVTGALEGAIAEDATTSVRTLLDNNCMILKKSAEVSGTLGALSPKGLADEKTRQVTHRLAEIKRDAEHYFLNGTKANEVSTTPRQMDGLVNLVAGNVDVTGALVKANLIAGMKLLYDAGQGGANVFMFVDPATMTKVNALLESTSQAQHTQGGGQVLGINVTTFLCEYGTANIVMNRHMAANTILIADMDKVTIAELRSAQSYDVAKTGDSDKTEVLLETSIKLENTYAGATITGFNS